MELYWNQLTIEFESRWKNPSWNAPLVIQVASLNAHGIGLMLQMHLSFSVRGVCHVVEEMDSLYLHAK